MNKITIQKTKVFILEDRDVSKDNSGELAKASYIDDVCVRILGFKPLENNVEVLPTFDLDEGEKVKTMVTVRKEVEKALKEDYEVSIIQQAGYNTPDFFYSTPGTDYNAMGTFETTKESYDKAMFNIAVANTNDKGKIKDNKENKLICLCTDLGMEVDVYRYIYQDDTIIYINEEVDKALPTDKSDHDLEYKGKNLDLFRNLVALGINPDDYCEQNIFVLAFDWDVMLCPNEECEVGYTRFMPTSINSLDTNGDVHWSDINSVVHAEDSDYEPCTDRYFAYSQDIVVAHCLNCGAPITIADWLKGREAIEAEQEQALLNYVPVIIEKTVKEVEKPRTKMSEEAFNKINHQSLMAELKKRLNNPW